MWAERRCTPGCPYGIAGRLLGRVKSPAGRPRGRAAAYSWRCRRGKAGHRPRRPVRGERGKRPGLVPPPDHPGRGRAGSCSAGQAGTWRSRRSSPRPGKPVTWRRAAASSQQRDWDGGRSLVNTGVPWPEPEEAEAWVLRIQTKLHQWATDDPGRRFDDLYNLVADPAVLVVAWTRVRGNRGKRSAGVDRVRPDAIFSAEEEFLPQLRDDLKARRFTPLPVRERMIPKPGSSKLRRLGIPTARDRTVQAALKLVLEPIFEADFKPCSYGFRPRRRAQDAIAEIHLFGTRGYRWVLDADIEACFDAIDHTALMGRVRSRVSDKRVLALVKAFLKAGILTELGEERDTPTGTPQGGILSPLLANIALSVLDQHVHKR